MYGQPSKFLLPSIPAAFQRGKHADPKVEAWQDAREIFRHKSSQTETLKSLIFTVSSKRLIVPTSEDSVAVCPISTEYKAVVQSCNPGPLRLRSPPRGAATLCRTNHCPPTGCFVKQAPSAAPRPVPFLAP